jgi:hypothetical protein
LDLALARIKDNLGQLRGPIQRSTQDTLRRKIASRVKIAHLRYCLGAALAVALVGIAVNALLLQRERHPAPLFGSAAPKPQAAAPAPGPGSRLKVRQHGRESPVGPARRGSASGAPGGSRPELCAGARSDRCAFGRRSPK